MSTCHTSLSPPPAPPPAPRLSAPSSPRSTPPSTAPATRRHASLHDLADGLAGLLPVVLSITLLLIPGPVAAQETPSSPASSDPAPTVGERTMPAAAYEFALAKMMVDEGDYRGALVAFERALEIDPDAAYVRIEYAEFLARLGRFGRDRDERLSQLLLAERQARRAAELLPGNVDALRAQAAAALALAGEEPSDPSYQEAALEALEGVRERDPGDVRSLLSLGQIYLRRGAAARAADVFDDVVSIAPGYQPAWRFLAESLLQSDQDERAVEPLQRVLAGEPEAESLRLTLAEILSELGRHDEAAAVLLEAPDGLQAPEARVRLATELYLAGELSEAGDTLARLVEERPDNRYLRLLQGLVLSAQARNAEALATLEPLLDEGPGDGDLAATVSQLLLREGRSDEAVDTLRQALADQEARGDGAEARRSRLALARLYGELDRWGQVVTILEPLTGAADPAAGLLRVDALVELGRGSEALAALDRLAAERGPGADVIPLEAKRAEVLARLGRPDEAVEVVRALDDDPEGFLRGIEALHRAERWERSLELLEEFVATRPASRTAFFLRASALERSGRIDEAVAAFEDLIERQPDFHPALNYLGYLWIDRGENLERAVALVEQAVEQSPGNGAYLDSLGWGYYRLGRLEEAREQLERAARLVQDPVVWEHLGDVYRALGEDEAAREAYRRALELDGDDPEELARKLGELEGSEVERRR